ncbi:MAG: HAMP domain-containing protein [Candidatus Omnitrophica bacterium]|nr:HAMP domain-containing protein [Candidatus Omnitrophota bacterium]
MLFVFLSGFMAILIGAAAGYLLGIRLLQNLIGDSHAKISKALSDTISLNIQDELEKIEIYLENPRWKDIIRTQNSEYEDIQEQERLSILLDKDKRWRFVEERAPLIEKHIANETSNEIRDILQVRPNIKEMFLTDRYGGLVASSAKTTDYYQADEKWWQEAFSGTEGMPYLQGYEYDESAQVLGIAFAVPIRGDDGQVIGINKTVVDPRFYFSDFDDFRIGATGHAVLMDEDNRVIYHKGVEPLGAKFLEKEDFSELKATSKNYLKAFVPLHGKQMLITFDKVRLPFVKGEDIEWYACVVHSTSEVFAPVGQLITGIVLVFCVSLLILGAIVYFTSRLFVKPLRDLKHGAMMVARGNLDYRTDIRTGDEVEEISRAFNVMTDRIKHDQEVLKDEVMRRKISEEKLKKRARQLQAVNEELETFSYSISHDLRAPLRSIGGFSNILLREYSDKLDEKGKDYLHRAENAAKTMGQMIEDILVLSRVSRRDIVSTEVNLSDIARKISKELKSTDPSRDVEFVIRPDVIARGDSGLLSHLMRNLLENAWKFTAKEEKARIEFGVESANARNTYFVRDNGVGFDKRYADKLFGPFQRLHSATEFGGTGIGLATVKRIVARHGGTIHAESEVGEGAAFYFTLSE